MIVTFKTLQQQGFKIEIDESETVKALKEKVQAEKGEDYPVGGQKLIYAGKILEDAKTLKEYNIDETGFIVVMVTKPKPSPAPESKSEESTSTAAPAPAKEESPKPAAAPAEAPAAVAPSTPATTAATPATDTAATTASTPSTALGVLSAESTLVTGEDFEAQIQEMMAMGFSRDLVLQAMKASFNNPTRAVDYLLTGIPDSFVEESMGPAEAVGVGVDEGDQEALDEARPMPDDPNPLAFLRTLPQFIEMKRMVQRNPEILPTLLQQMGQSNPQLLQIISQNQQDFVDMLNAPDAPGAAPTGVGGVGGAPLAAQEGQEGGNQASGQAPAGYINVTADEQAAINRLKALGFPEPMCIQAFFACDKNEQLAANFLLEEMERFPNS